MSNEAAETAYEEVYNDPALETGTPTDEDAPFQVGEEVEVDFTTVKRDIIPAASNVLFEILQSSTAKNKKETIKYLSVKLKIVDGILRQNEATGEQEYKYAGKHLNTKVMDLIVWHDPKAEDPKGWWKDQDANGRPYMFNSKCFALALGYDLKSVKFNDQFHADIQGRQIVGNIRHKTEKDGDVNVVLDGWKKAPESEG